MSVALLSVAAVALDALLGEPKRWHPLVAFGNFAGRIEQRFNGGGRGWRSHGVSGWCLAVLPPVALVWLLSLSSLGWLIDILVLYFALGLKSLAQHALPVAQALRALNCHRDLTHPLTLLCNSCTEFTVPNALAALALQVANAAFRVVV